MPTQSRLESALQQTFEFQLSDGRSVGARLIAVPIGIPMDDDYVCYSALFEFTPGVHLPQDIYCIRSPTGESWNLLVTPHRSGATGAARMSAVIHCLRASMEKAAP